MFLLEHASICVRQIRIGIVKPRIWRCLELVGFRQLLQGLFHADHVDAAHTLLHDKIRHDICINGKLQTALLQFGIGSRVPFDQAFNGRGGIGNRIFPTRPPRLSGTL